MTQQTRANNKLKFETGDVPVQSDFEDLIDSYLSLLDDNSKTFTSGGTDDYVVSVSATLNDPGAAGGSDIFRAIKVNVTETDTTGWDETYLLDLQVGGTSLVAVGNDGNVYIGTTTAPTGTASKVVVLGDNAGAPTPGTDTCTIHAAAETEIIGTNIKVYATAENGDLNPLVPYKLPKTLAAAATTLVADAPLVELTGDAGGNSLATITGDMAYGGSRIVVLFTDGNVTIAHDDSHASNTIDLSSGVGGNFTGADDVALHLQHDGVSWYEVGCGSIIVSNSVSLNGNSARTMGMQRHSTSNTAGNSLTVSAGGATSGATDKSGGDLILKPGASTGTGANKVRIQGYSRATSSGTSDNTLYDRIITVSAKPLTDAATSLFEIALPAGGMTGGVLHASIRASNGTDHQVRTQTVRWAAVNKAGTYTKNTAVGQQAIAASAGTLTATWSLLNGTNKLTMQVTPSGSLTETIYQITYMIVNNTPQQITIL